MIFYYKTLIVIASPLFFTLVMLIFWLIYKLKYHLSLWKHIIDHFLLTFSIIITYFLPSIMNALAQFINCTRLYDEEYITNNLIEKCTNNPRYDLWRFFLIIPSFIFFGAILPLIAFLYAYNNRTRLFDRKVVKKISFLLNGYSEKTFYW